MTLQLLHTLPTNLTTVLPQIIHTPFFNHYCLRLAILPLLIRPQKGQCCLCQTAHTSSNPQLFWLCVHIPPEFVGTKGPGSSNNLPKGVCLSIFLTHHMYTHVHTPAPHAHNQTATHMLTHPNIHAQKNTASSSSSFDFLLASSLSIHAHWRLGSCITTRDWLMVPACTHDACARCESTSYNIRKDKERASPPETG